MNSYSMQIHKYIEDIHFLGVNTKYISSSAVKKISSFQECVVVRSTSENADIFTALDEIYLVFAKKGKFYFYCILNEYSESTT